MSLTWIFAMLIGLLTSLLYVDQYFGISVFVMTILCVYTMYLYKKEAGMVIGPHFYIVSGYMLLLSPVFAVTTVSVIRFWAGFILIVLLLALAICEIEFLWPKWLVGAMAALFGGISRMGSLFTHGKSMPTEGRKQIGYVFIGMIVALPILLVAGGLLASADTVMAELMEDIFNSLRFEDFGVWVWRVIVFVVVSALTFGYSVWLVDKQEQGEPSEVIEAKRLDVIPATVSATILILLNILYVIFAYIQIRFLFFGTLEVGPGTYKYAEYARSGFFELVTLSVLNTIGILAIKKFTKTHLFNEISLTVTAACTFVMIASSWYKMYLYEQAYGYTQLRLYVYIILAFMIVFMALITFGIWKKQYRVIEWSIVIGLCYFLVVSYVNVDAVIVENNVARYEDTDEIDLYYLMNELSEDATPSVIAFIENEPTLLEGDWQSNRYRDMKSRMNRNEEDRQFFEFNYRHSLAVKAVEDVAAKQ